MAACGMARNRNRYTQNSIEEFQINSFTTFRGIVLRPDLRELVSTSRPCCNHRSRPYKNVDFRATCSTGMDMY